MIYFLILLFIFIHWRLAHLIKRESEKLNHEINILHNQLMDHIDQRQDEQSKWLFDSLYSISPKVTLPEEVAKPLSTEKTEVFKLEDNEMAEINGQLDDWHGEENE